MPLDEPTPTTEWLLPHFPVVRADRTTTKTRIVFDVSVKFHRKSLNSEALPGTKLQADMFSILVRFRKELVALVGDVSQMYHQLVLPLKTQISMEESGSEQGTPKSTNSCDTRLEGVVVLIVRGTYGRSTRMIIKQSTL